jgi:hypothetical protein
MELLEQAVFVNGTVGAGKTTVAYTIGKLLKESSIAHAAIDLDTNKLSETGPSPSSELPPTNLRFAADSPPATRTTAMGWSGI